MTPGSLLAAWLPHHSDPGTATPTPVTPVHRHLQLRVPFKTAPPSTAAHTPVIVHRHLQLRVPLLMAPPRPPRHPKYAHHTVHPTITPSQSSLHISLLPGPAGCSCNPVQRGQGASQRMHRSAGSDAACPHTNLRTPGVSVPRSRMAVLGCPPDPSNNSGGLHGHPLAPLTN